MNFKHNFERVAWPRPGRTLGGFFEAKICNMGFLIIFTTIKTGLKATSACWMLLWTARVTSPASPSSTILEIDFDAFQMTNQIGSC